MTRVNSEQRTAYSVLCTYMIVLTSMVVSMAIAEAADAARRAERLYEQEHYEEAVQQLQRAVAAAPEEPRLYYNLGAATYRQQNFEQSTDAWNRASSLADTTLQGPAAYNRGNAWYRLGERQAQSNPQQALQMYQRAQGDYALAIEHDSMDRDAQFNYELVTRRIEALQQQHEQQQEPSQDQQESQDQQAQAPEQQQDQRRASRDRQQQHEQPPERQQQSAHGDTDPLTEEERAQLDMPLQPSDTEQPSQDSQAQARMEEREQQLSQQEAAWILDAMRDEERPLPSSPEPRDAQQESLANDW